MRDSLGHLGDKPREACGIFGISGHPEAAKLCCLGLHALQHRGQESAGIATVHDRRVLIHKGMGLVNEVFAYAISAACRSRHPEPNDAMPAFLRRLYLDCDAPEIHLV